MKTIQELAACRSCGECRMSYVQWITERSSFGTHHIETVTCHDAHRTFQSTEKRFVATMNGQLQITVVNGSSSVGTRSNFLYNSTIGFKKELVFV